MAYLAYSTYIVKQDHIPNEGNFLVLTRVMNIFHINSLDHHFLQDDQSLVSPGISYSVLFTWNIPHSMNVRPWNRPNSGLINPSSYQHGGCLKLLDHRQFI